MDNCWDNEKEHCFGPVISDTMSILRWLQIKRKVKVYNVFKEKQKDEVGYDPTQKYCKVWGVMGFNLNAFIKKGRMDITIDKTTWPSACYGPVHNRPMKKKESKGGQHTLAVEAERRHMIIYTPRHKLWPLQPLFMAEGTAELKRLIDDIIPLVKEEDKEPMDKRRQIFDKCPNLGMDNHFSGDATSKLVGNKGFKSTMTCWRGIFPAGVSKKHFHSLKE